MPIRVPWDKYEVALLFRANEIINDGADINAVAVFLSDLLRRLAIQRGKNIDTTFRNVNGMKMQLGNVQYLFTNGKKGLSGASSLIRKMFQIYQQNHTEYQKILEEAIQLTDNEMSIEEVFLDFIKDIPQKNKSDISCGHTLQKKSEKDKETSSWLRYKEVLKQAFSKGFQKESGLDMKKLRKRWLQIHGEILQDSDSDIRHLLTQHCVDTGNRWYLAETLLSECDRKKVLQHIDRTFDGGKSVLYYSSIYTAMESQLESAVLTEHLLACYLRSKLKGIYIIREDYLTNDCHYQLDIVEEIKKVIIAYGRPIHTDELTRMLHHLPCELVIKELHQNREFLRDSLRMYFHISMVDLSIQELEKIAVIIQDKLDEQGYMFGNRIQSSIAQKYPETAERLSFLTTLGVREAVAYMLRDRFTFNGPVITNKGKSLNMISIFATFCQRHTPFTLDDLSSLAKECGTDIYWDTVHENCARINEIDFVASCDVHWDITHTDEAIALSCPGEYTTLKSISPELFTCA